jgi:WD40 repeat protein
LSPQKKQSPKAPFPQKNNNNQQKYPLQGLSPMYRAQTRVGGELVRYPVCFSDDEKCLFSCVGGVIKAHNVQTGALQGEFRGHTARVSGVYLNPLNSLQLYSTSHDGTIRRWDPSEGVCLQQYNLGIPVLTGTLAAGHHLYLALDPSHYSKFLPQNKPDEKTQISNQTHHTSQKDTQKNNIDEPIVQEVQMPTLKQEQKAKSLAFRDAHTQKNHSVFICAFDLLTPQDASISTDFIKNSSKPDPNSTSMADEETTSLTPSPPSNPLQLLFTMKEFTAISRSKHGDLLCAVGGNVIHVYSKKFNTHGFAQHPHPITCVDVHPQQDLLAVGDITGAITLYVNASSLLTHSVSTGLPIGQISEKPGQNALATSSAAQTKVNRVATSFLHWHSHPVRSCKFSVDGNYLLTGGYEGVLVTWQLANMTSHFLPRLSSFLQHIAVSPKGGAYALSCGDNSIQTLGAYNSQLKHVAHGVNILNPSNRIIPTTNVLALREANKAILITDQGHFQIFDVCQDTHVGTFNLLDRNLLPESQLQQHLRDNQNNQTNNHLAQFSQSSDSFTQNQLQHAAKITSSLDITHVIVSPDARWSLGFYTTPSKNGLRIWAHSSELLPSTEFVSRCVWHDANNKPVISGTFSSDSKMLVTGHRDGTVRIWSLTTEQDVDYKYPAHLRYMGQGWAIQNTINYQGLPPSVVVFSSDATILGIGFGNIFTLWSIDANFSTTFLFSHTFSGSQTEILSINFLSQYPTVHVATQHGLYTFDLLTLSCVGSYFCNIAAVTTHPSLPIVYVMTVVPHIKRISDPNDNYDQFDSNDEDEDDDGNDDTSMVNEMVTSDDYLGDEVDALIAEQPDGVPPGAIGRDRHCPIYRKYFKHLYRVGELTGMIQTAKKKNQVLQSLRTLPKTILRAAEMQLGIALPINRKIIDEHGRKIGYNEFMRNRAEEDKKKERSPESTNILTKPTKECCLLIFKDNVYDKPAYATSLMDVMLTKTKYSKQHIANNIYNASCYEASVTLTRDFYVYLNRSRELTLIPVSNEGVQVIQQKSTSTAVQWTMESTLQEMYNIHASAAKSAAKSVGASEFTLMGVGDDSNGSMGANSELDRLVNTLANTPAHQIISLSAIYEQFMSPFLQDKK